MKQKLVLLIGCVLVFAIVLTGCGQGKNNNSTLFSTPLSTPPADRSDESEKALKICISTDTQSIIFELNGSLAAKSLYDQLPLTLSVENYGTNEKIFYPPEELDISDAPLAKGPAGILTYYAPWGDVAIFYGECAGASGLYELGKAVSGAEQISELTGSIRIEKVAENISDTQSAEPAGATDTEEGGSNMRNIEVVVGDKIFSATLYDNEAAQEFIARLPVTLNMSELNGNEKYYYLDDSLPADASSPGSIKAGELMLYGSDCLVLFYESFSTSYSYTPLGYLNNPSGISEAVGGESITVTFRVK